MIETRDGSRIVTLPGPPPARLVPPGQPGAARRARLSGRPTEPRAAGPAGTGRNGVARSEAPAGAFIADRDEPAPGHATGAHAAPSAGREPGPRRWPGGFLVLAFLVVVLNLIGLVMILSASSVESLRQYGSPWYYFERQLLWLCLGSGAFAITVTLDYRRWRRFGALAAAGTLLLLLAVMAPGLGISVGGSSRWLGVGSWRLQPSELAKLALVVFAADVLDRRARRVRQWRYSMVPVLTVFAVMAGLVMLQPDMGTTMVMACIVLGILYSAGAPLAPMGAVLGVGGALAMLMAVAAPYRWRRLTAFLHPFADASNTGYQSAQGLVALGSGRLAGLGIGASRASWGYLPNQQTDFIFAVIGEETGLIGSLLLVGLFLAFAVLGVRSACRAPDRFGALLAAGITAWIVGQAVINIGAVVGLLPVTGVPLPFVSFGGSSLIIALGAAGILANIAKQSR
jgi:cell division protein FtsW